MIGRWYRCTPVSSEACSGLTSAAARFGGHQPTPMFTEQGSRMLVADPAAALLGVHHPPGSEPPCVLLSAAALPGGSPPHGPAINALENREMFVEPPGRPPLSRSNTAGWGQTRAPKNCQLSLPAFSLLVGEPDTDSGYAFVTDNGNERRPDQSRPQPGALERAPRAVTASR
jgi:hypothetical protein